MAESVLLTRQRVLAAKTETTVGVNISLAAADAAHDVFDPQMTADIDYVDRLGQSSASPQQGTIGGQRMSCTFQTELAGSGGSGNPLWASTFLEACAFSVSGSTYKPETGSASYKTITMGLYEDGRLRQMAGCVGNVEISMPAGRICPISWTFQGKYVPPSVAAILAPTYPTVLPPRFAGGTMTVAGETVRIAEATLSINNVIKMREDATDDNGENYAAGTGYRAGVVVDRRIAWTINPEAETVPTAPDGTNWYEDFVGHLANGNVKDPIEAAINVVVGLTANNIVTINSPKAQLTNVQPGDREGIITDELTFVANRSAAAGEDELTIAFS